MLFLYTGGSGSPIQARQTAPIYLIFIITAIIFLLITIIGIIIKKYLDYIKSDAYRQKEMNRPTKKSDINKIAELANLNKDDISILWDVCQFTKCNNVFYLLTTNAEVNELFKNAYYAMKEHKFFTDIKMNLFFECLYKLEMYVAQTKKIYSTTMIPAQSIIFYISEEGEQYPFTVVKNSKDFFIAEIPEFMAKSEHKPEKLVRNRFTFKTIDGLSYNLVTRIIRYEDTPENKHYIILSHTDQLECQSQRHFKRDFFQEDCQFARIHIHPEAEDPAKRYLISENKHAGKITNISAGGCCIQTELPVKENQSIVVTLPSKGLTEQMPGIIKRTRKLPNGKFALHIQFSNISIQTKNKIYALVYKYEF